MENHDHNDKEMDSSSSSSSSDEDSSTPQMEARTAGNMSTQKPKKSPVKGQKKDPSSLKTLRFHIQLDADIEMGDGGEDDKYEFNWLDLIAEENEKKERKGDGHMGGNNFGGAALDPYASDDDEQLRALARKFENKYGAEDVKKKKKARKLDDYADLGYGYDSNDPFIDNSEVHDEIVPANLTTAHGGFYVNIGALEFKARESADEDSDVEAIINEGEKAEKKRKYNKKKEAGGQNGLPDEPPAKKKIKRIHNPDGTTTLVPVSHGPEDPAGASASGSMDEGDGKPKKPRIRREGAKPLGRPKKRNPDGSLVHPPKMPKMKHPVFDSNGTGKHNKIGPNHQNHTKIMKNKKGRNVMKVNTPGSYANSSNSTSVVDLTDGDERSTPKSQKNGNECNDEVVKLLQSVSDQVGKKLTSGESASTSYKGVTITPTAGGSKPKKSSPTTPNVSLVATSTASSGSKAKPTSAVTVKKLLEEQSHQQKAKNQTPQPVPVKKKPSSATNSAQALQQQKKKQQQLQQQLAQQQQQDLMNYLTALAAYQQAGSPSGKNSTNAELLSALAGLSASGTMTPELYAQLLATQGQMNDVLLQQFAASFYPTTSSLSAFTTSSGPSRKGSATGASSAAMSKAISSSFSKAKTTVTNSNDRKLPSSTASPSSSSPSVVVSSMSPTMSSGLAQAAASAAAATKAKHSSAHSIESLSVSSLQGTKAGQSLLVGKQGTAQNTGGKSSVQVVSSSGTKTSVTQVSGGSKVGNKSLTKCGADSPVSSGATSILKTSSPAQSVPTTTVSSQQQQLLRQEQFEAEQKEFAQAQAKFEREEIERLKAEQEKRMKMIEQHRKEQEEMQKKQELADAQKKEEIKKKQLQVEAARKQEDLRKEALRKQQLEEKLRQEAIQRQNELEAQRKQQEMLRRQQEQEMLRKQQQEQERLRKQQQEQERLRKQQQEQELLRKQQEQERVRKQQEQERLRKQQQEQERARKLQEQEQLRRKQLEQERQRQQQQEQERARKLQEQEHLRRKQQEQELLRKQQLEQEALRKKQEEMELLRKRQQEQELLRKQQEQEQRKKQQQMDQLRQQQDHLRKQELLRKQQQQLQLQQQQQQQQHVPQSQTIFIQQDGQQAQQGYVSSSGIILNQSPSSTISMSNYSLGNNANAMNGSLPQIIHSSPQRVSSHQTQISMSPPQPKQQQSQLIGQHTSPQQQQQQQQHQIIVHQNISPRQSSQGNFNLSMNHTSPSTSNVHFLQQQKQQIVVSSPNLNQGLKLSANHGSSSSSTSSSSSPQMKLPSMPNTSVLVSSFGGSPTGLMSPQSPMYAQANNSMMMNAQQMQQQPQQQHPNSMSNSGSSGHIIVSSTNNINNHHGYYSVHKQ